MKYGPPGITHEDADRLEREHAQHPERTVIPDHIMAFEGGRAAEIKQEELRDLHADEQRRLSEVRRNL